MERWHQAVLLGLVFIAIIFLVLGGADAGMMSIADGQGCPLQFPKQA
jgi:hypothetical protein